MSYKLTSKTAALQPYDPSEGTYRIRLDANESFLMPTVDDRELMAGAAADTALNRYPDPLAEEVCRAFAGLYEIRRELVTAGNGSDELISLILSTFLQKGEKVLSVSPDFSMYRFYTAITETPCVVMDKGDDLRIDPQRVLDTIPVSYTHLDVYKRQASDRPRGAGAWHRVSAGGSVQIPFV